MIARRRLELSSENYRKAGKAGKAGKARERERERRVSVYEEAPGFRPGSRGG